MNKKSFCRMSKYKKLKLLLAIFGSGGYLLTPTNIAYASNDDMIESNQSNYDDEIFPPEYLDLDQFVVTADRTPISKWATPTNVIIITDKEIEANHYQTLSEALNHVNGIFGQNKIVTGLEWHQMEMKHWSWEGSEKIFILMKTAIQ